jgi:hypothetical protein
MNKRLKIALIAIITIVVVLATAFLVYASVYYRADALALKVLQNNPSIGTQDNLTILSPANPSDTALIFYPGAKVEAIAYLPILEKITQTSNITCILVKMPFNLAIFDANAADEVIAQFPEIKNWYIGGHSLGGAMASNFASGNQDKVKGLILLGAYVYGDYPPENALTIYGSFNTSVAEQIDYSDNIVVIEGGNHAQFGNYGKQAGDPDATISSEVQQNIAVIATEEFLAKKGN